jgi:hypothetical protein
LKNPLSSNSCFNNFIIPFISSKSNLFLACLNKNILAKWSKKEGK